MLYVRHSQMRLQMLYVPLDLDAMHLSIAGSLQLSEMCGLNQDCKKNVCLTVVRTAKSFSDQIN
jgi:hypothetical protein